MTSAPASFADLLSDAVSRRGLSLGRIRYHLRRRGHDLSVATLSYWKRGVSRPTRASSLAAVEALEEILEVPRGVLSGALVERLSPEPEVAPNLDALAASLGLSWDDGLVRTAVQDVVLVDAQGRHVGHRIRETAFAQRAEVDRYPVAVWSDDPAAELGVETGGNCRLGDEVRSTSALVAEIRLPRSLAVGERWTTDVSVSAPMKSDDEGAWGRWLTTRVSVLHYVVQFDPVRVPRSAEAVTTLKGVTTAQPMVLRGPCLELHLEDVGPGTVTLRWTW